MKSLRLAILTRRFWPHTGAREIGVAELAETIKRRGHHVEILTVRWLKAWPRNFTIREIDVTRIGPPTTGPWGTFRFVRNLNRFLRDSHYDGLVIHGLGDESWSAIRSVGRTVAKPIPVVLRIDHHDFPPADKANSRFQFSNRQLSTLNSASAILADSASTAEKLLDSRVVDEGKIQVVLSGVEIASDFKRSIGRQSVSRLALSDAHPILQIEPVNPLVLCGAPMNGDRGVLDLVDCWSKVLDQFPSAKLWIIGDGRKGRPVWDRIVKRGLANSIVLPGYFDDLADLYQAADLYVHPLRESAHCEYLLRALATGTCVVAASTPSVNQIIHKNDNGLLTSPQNPQALAEAICLALNSSEIRNRLGSAAQSLAAEQFDIQKYADSVLAPFMERVPVSS